MINKRPFIRVLFFILNSTEAYRRYLWIIMLCMMIVAIDNVVKPVLIKGFIDTVSGYSQDNLLIIGGLYALLQSLMVGAWTLSDFCLTRYSGPLRCDLTQYFMDNLYGQSYTFFQDHLSGSMSSHINDVFEMVPAIVNFVIYQCSYFITTTGIGFFLLWSIHPYFGLGLILWTLLFCVLTLYAVPKTMELSQNTSQEKSHIFGLIADYCVNMMTVKSFVQKKYESKLFGEKKHSFIQASHEQGMYLMRFYLIQGISTSFYVFSFVFFLIYGQTKGWASPGDIALVVMVNFGLISKLYDVSHQVREVFAQWGSVHQALMLLEKDKAITDRDDAPALEIQQGHIIFEKVDFHYKGVDPLFNQTSLEILAGQKVGLVGYSGGGKTTFAHLIVRFHEVSAGAIYIDGQNIASVKQDSLHQAITIIPQEPSLFHRSIFDNIRYGRLEATEQEVIAAAKNAYAHDFIRQLPSGYASLVGERGIKLSGGQRQRISIARAFLKNSPILILDEATSQLDSLTESMIQESLWTLMHNKTTLVIAHRLSTLLHMDRILVFNEGQIVEDGSHSSLLAQAGLYKKLWEAQIEGCLPV